MEVYKLKCAINVLLNLLSIIRCQIEMDCEKGVVSSVVRNSSCQLFNYMLSSDNLSLYDYKGMLLKCGTILENVVCFYGGSVLDLTGNRLLLSLVCINVLVDDLELSLDLLMSCGCEYVIGNVNSVGTTVKYSDALCKLSKFYVRLRDEICSMLC